MPHAISIFSKVPTTQLPAFRQISIRYSRLNPRTMEGDEQFVSVDRTCIPDFDEDNETDIEDDASFPLPCEDETEFAVEWCTRGIVNAFVAREMAQRAIEEGMSSSRPQRSPSSSKPRISTQKIAPYSLDENKKDESRTAAKRTKRSASCPRKSCKREADLAKRALGPKRCSRVKKRTHSVPQSSFRWILPKPETGAGELLDGGVRIIADFDVCTRICLFWWTFWSCTLSTWRRFPLSQSLLVRVFRV
ncbi:hypothetical protein BKA64DRAFT_110655 [Cadophora sp. MPI-SDFR-AT-0126]|nr:hypothetical protein BKA64DRAFT_110655 [Leotiomycetes sp. MPI-SDFR-AT-0126]